MSQTEIVLSPGEGYSPIVDWRARPGPPGPETGPKILGLGHAILRRGKLLIVTLILLNVLAIVGVRQLTPRYTASADVLVGPREEQVVDLKAVLLDCPGRAT